MSHTNDIEDVLSSIRRLIATDGPGTQRTGPAPDPESSPVVPALILEPAARVTEPEDPFQTIHTLPAAPLDHGPKGSSEDPAGADLPQDVAALALQEQDVRDAEHFLTSPDTDLADFVTDLGTSPSSAFLESWIGGPTTPASVVPMPGYVENAAAMPLRPDAPESPGAETGLADLSPSGPSPVDDEALREMIAQVVREELAGELGERITRNVRKLVRREIRQIMASGDYD